jgi:hypothetical protein
LVFLYFLVLVLSTGAAAGSWLAWSWPLWSAGIKFSVEMMLFLRAGMLFKSWSGWCLAPVLSVAYVGYVLFFSLVGLAGPVKWKE